MSDVKIPYIRRLRLSEMTNGKNKRPRLVTSRGRPDNKILRTKYTPFPVYGFHKQQKGKQEAGCAIYDIKINKTCISFFGCATPGIWCPAGK
ncbi:MAG: hypothetical protein LBR46_08555 [Prevotella sp.]|nr:hypothetical protein [Prevotella sp.]